MAKEVASYNNPKFCSVIQVDEDISFVLDNRDIDFPLSVSSQKQNGISRKTYSKKQPISYNSTLTLLENQVSENSNIALRNKKSSLKSSPTKYSQEVEEILRKRHFDSGLSITPVPRKMRKKETSIKVSPSEINGHITNNPQKNSLNLVIPTPDPEIEIIQVIERGTCETFKRNSKNSCNGREIYREKLFEFQKKKTSKSLSRMLQLYHPSSDDVPITEADIAPIIPSNSFIPDKSISETNQDVVQSRNKLKLRTAISNASSLQIVEINGAKESDEKNAHKCNLYQPTSKTSPEKKNSGSRELKNLYENLNEISWAKEKDFKQMIRTDNRHSERITAKSTGGVGKNLRKLKGRVGNEPLYLCKQKRDIAKKNSVKFVLNKAKYGRLKSSINTIKKDGVWKPLVKPTKKTKVDINVKKLQPKVSVKQKTDTRLKPKGQNISSVKTHKITSNSENNKLGNSSRSIEKSVLPSALKKAFKIDTENRVSSKNSSNGKEVKKIEYTDGVRILRKSLVDNEAYAAAVKGGRRLRVHVKPLELTSWSQTFFELFQEYVIDQTASKLQASSPESIKAMFDELMESFYNIARANAKIFKKKKPKKKKPEEEVCRSGVRQSINAIRYKEIVTKQHENYIEIILMPNTDKQNSLSIEAMRELKHAFLFAKKDPNCRAVLLSSSGSNFCTGIDLSLLIGNNKRQLAEEMAVAIKELVLTLSTFAKPVVAAVNGTAVGLGVALLTLCDVVLASDKATFCIPAARLGYIPEGAITITLPQAVGSIVATDLLMYGKRFTADQAMRNGLISEVVWDSNLMNEVLPRIRVIVSQSIQVLKATKSMIRCHLWNMLKTHMDIECSNLPDFWLGAHCQSKIKEALQAGWLNY